jgi:hypothetical protein
MSFDLPFRGPKTQDTAVAAKKICLVSIRRHRRETLFIPSHTSHRNTLRKKRDLFFAENLVFFLGDRLKIKPAFFQLFL